MLLRRSCFVCSCLFANAHCLPLIFLCWPLIIHSPGGLKSDPATSTAILTDDNMACGSVNRADLAKLIVAALASEKTHKKILTCVDPEQPYAGEDERPAPASFDF